MTQEATYIAFDIESGGIPDECTLLTAHFIVLDQNLNKLDSLDLAVKPDDGKPYVCTAEGLSVNGINLVEHDKIAITQSKAGGLLFEFLNKYSNRGAWKLIPIGHNVAYDIKSVQLNLLSKKHFDKFVSYRVLDTGTIGQFLKLKGLIPNDKFGGLSKLMAHFGVEFEGRAHTAEADIMATVELLRKMRDV